ncbi:MAG: hypothetical protein AAB225_31230, partial [Acidobacteriota bacterium]
MKSRLNVGVIGLGRMGRVYAEGLAHRVPNARLVAVAVISSTSTHGEVVIAAVSGGLIADMGAHDFDVAR